MAWGSPFAGTTHDDIFLPTNLQFQENRAAVVILPICARAYDAFGHQSADSNEVACLPSKGEMDSRTVTDSMTPALVTGAFSGANADDAHLCIQWQIVRNDDGVHVFNVRSETCLTELTVPQYILEKDTQ